MPDLGPFCFRNSTDDPVDGLHVIFSGALGETSDGNITVGPPGRITTSDNQLNVFLEAPLAPDMPLCFTVSSESDSITVHTALWSSQLNIVGTAEAVPPK